MTTAQETLMQIAQFNADEQARFFDSLKENGLSEEDIHTVKMAVGFTRLFTDCDRYEAIKNAVKEKVVEELYPQQ